MPPFTGGWLRANYQIVYPQAVHTADPAHALTSEADINASTYTAPEGMAGTGSDVEYFGWMGGPGVTIEYEPQDHEWGVGQEVHPSDPYIGGTGIGGGDLTSNQRAAPVHGVDIGAPVRHAYNPAPYQDHTTRYESIRSESPGPLPIAPIATIRGSNSDPENNPAIDGQPDGFRHGEDLHVFVDRKFQYGERFHDLHIVTPNDAQRPTDQQRGSLPSLYLSPFNSARRAITRAFNTPSQLIAPPDFSADITTGEPPVDNEPMPEWGYT